MAWIEIGGIGIAYELVGPEGSAPMAITPGGRFSKDTPGIRPLAERLAATGRRVLIWDRPNCGASDICFDGPTESIQNADTLARLIAALGLGPTHLVGGSGGARDSILVAVRHPEVVRRLFVLWISGGPIGCAVLPAFYCAEGATAAMAGGMAAVAALPGWQEQVARNPGNRARLLAWEPMRFLERMQQWAAAFYPVEGMPMPGVTRADLASIAAPATVLRSGVSDVHHARATSEAVQRMIPGARLAEPPWGDTEWIERLTAQADGHGLFERWPLLADRILAFDAE